MPATRITFCAPVARTTSTSFCVPDRLVGRELADVVVALDPAAVAQALPADVRLVVEIEDGRGVAAEALRDRAPELQAVLFVDHRPQTRIVLRPRACRAERRGARGSRTSRPRGRGRRRSRSRCGRSHRTLASGASLIPSQQASLSGIRTTLAFHDAIASTISCESGSLGVGESNRLAVVAHVLGAVAVDAEQSRRLAVLVDERVALDRQAEGAGARRPPEEHDRAHGDRETEAAHQPTLRLRSFRAALASMTPPLTVLFFQARTRRALSMIASLTCLGFALGRRRRGSLPPQPRSARRSSWRMRSR